MKKALVFVLALILLVGVLAACGDKTPETTTPAGTTTTTTPAGGDATTTPTVTDPTQGDLTMSGVADTDPTLGEPVEGGVQLPWVPFA